MHDTLVISVAEWRKLANEPKSRPCKENELQIPLGLHESGKILRLSLSIFELWMGNRIDDAAFIDVLISWGPVLASTFMVDGNNGGICLPSLAAATAEKCSVQPLLHSLIALRSFSDSSNQTTFWNVSLSIGSTRFGSCSWNWNVQIWKGELDK